MQQFRFKKNRVRALKNVEGVPFQRLHGFCMKIIHLVVNGDYDYWWFNVPFKNFSLFSAHTICCVFVFLHVCPL